MIIGYLDPWGKEEGTMGFRLWHPGFGDHGVWGSWCTHRPQSSSFLGFIFRIL